MRRQVSQAHCGGGGSRIPFRSDSTPCPNGDNDTAIERKEVRVKPNRYQPTKAEIEAEFQPSRKAYGTAYTVNGAVRTLMRPVKVVEDPEA